MAYRITPTLGPDVEQHETKYYWDLNSSGQPSYALGTKVVGSDGHDYIHVKAGAALAKDVEVQINATTFVATAGAGGFTVPVAVKNGEYFHAKKTAL
ncbi:hypothetical protein J3U99_20715 [Brucella pituitosa]|uniref:hypothetical protein n=1 Tax=Brucella pituitosa TaxID=571256 RepID=UPI002006941B|nr:hypothetical protein [Brucella pituitosa]MCK4207194.1 hypothetical protein [Brucella pituitosa]